MFLILQDGFRCWGNVEYNNYCQCFEETWTVKWLSSETLKLKQDLVSSAEIRSVSVDPLMMSFFWWRLYSPSACESSIIHTVTLRENDRQQNWRKRGNNSLFKLSWDAFTRRRSAGEKHDPLSQKQPTWLAERNFSQTLLQEILTFMDWQRRIKFSLFLQTQKINQTQHRNDESEEELDV